MLCAPRRMLLRTAYSDLRPLARLLAGRVKPGSDLTLPVALLQLDPLLAASWGMKPLRMVAWEWEGALSGIAVSFIAKPFNGPGSERLLIGLARGRSVSRPRVILLGPERWDGAFEARLTPPELRLVPSPLPSPGPETHLFAAEGVDPKPLLTALAPEAIPAFHRARCHMLRIGPEGCWAITPPPRESRMCHDLVRLAESLAALERAF